MSGYPRSLPIPEWPQADRDAWEQACRPGSRFIAGGAASRLSVVSRTDYANRYGAFLGFLQRTGRLNVRLGTGVQIDPPNVAAYLADLHIRLRLTRERWRRRPVFAGSDAGGQRAVAIYTLIQTAKLNDVDPQAWLADILARLQDHPARRIDELLPWSWNRERAQKAAA